MGSCRLKQLFISYHQHVQFSIAGQLFQNLDKLDVNILLSPYDDAGHQPAAVSAVPRACANRPPHKQHVSHDTLSSHSHAMMLLI